ncbi:MAG: nitroreductase family protein [Chloroflexi bacterium]|nr:nitroreductase family protein [Chloroflexota bacterium]
MEVHDAIRTKYALRHFADQPLPDDAIRRILNAGRRSQSSKNTQPWQFVVVRDREKLIQLSQCGTYAGHMAGAAMGVAIASPDPATRWQIAFDLGQAAAYMQLAAWELGIGSCLAAIYEPDTARAILGIPADWFFDAAISFGYPAPDLPSRQPREVGRKSFDEVVRWEKW